MDISFVNVFFTKEIQNMQLHEKIRKISHQYNVSLAKISKDLKLLPQTFIGYLSEKRQDNLWPLLPKILEMFPKVNRDWLYFGEGEMLGTDTPTKQIAEIEAENKLLKQSLEEERTLNKKLVTRLLLEGSPQADLAEQSTGERIVGQK